MNRAWSRASSTWITPPAAVSTRIESSVAGTSKARREMASLARDRTTNAAGVSDIETQTLTIAKAASSTAVSSSLGSSVYGQSVTFTATVSSTAGIPDGTVMFDDGGTTLGSAPVDGSGVATFVIATLTAGSHTITATYSGGATFNGSAGNTGQSVAVATTTPAPTSSPTVPDLPDDSERVIEPSASLPTGRVRRRSSFKDKP